MGSSLKKRFVGLFLLFLTVVSLGGSVSSVFAGYSNVEDISEDGWKTIRGAAKKAKELGISAEAFAGMMGNEREGLRY